MKTRHFATLLLLVLLCVCGRTAEQKEETVPPPARSLDQLSFEQLRTFLKGHTAGDWRDASDMKRGEPAPPLQKPYPEDATLIDLVEPGDIKCGNAPLRKVINQRRSRREYTDGSLTNEELSFLLWCTQGISAYSRYDNGEIAYHLRTVPSGGSRHPFETYLVIKRVEGMAPGLYRFLAVEHKLLLIREAGDLSAAVRKACYGQKHIGDAAVVFVWAAMPYRTEWKYGCVSHRMIAMEAGHICQNLYLAAESIGAGACANLGYHQHAMDQLIGVDGKDEFAIYVASVGKIAAEKEKPREE
jgi:SagB-type dehydrogenase family enzyme